jgi:endonuclease/exonuclease/phosphatase family metal-dependent hydrolase
MKKILAFLFVFQTLFAALPYVAEDFVLTVDQMEEKNKEFQLLLDKNLKRFKIYSELKNYNKAYDLWSDVLDEFFYLQLLYYQTVNLTSNLILKGYAGSFVLDLHKEFRAAIQEKNIIDVFTNNALKADLLSPHQRFITKSVIERTYQPNEESLKVLDRFKMENFDSYESDVAVVSEVVAEIKVLNANVLGFPGILTYFFGGLAPWEKRVERITNKLIEEGADVIFLNEVFHRKFALKLIEALKTHYRFFAFDAGSQHGTLSPEEIGFNSGLLICSKIPINDLLFIPFDAKETSKGGVRRGILKGNYKLGNKPIHFVLTHFQSGLEEEDKKIRLAQLEECRKILGKLDGFLVGDLNINAFSDEFKKLKILKKFQSLYLRGQKEVNEKNATETDYFNDLTHTPLNQRDHIKPSFEILDYCLIPKKSKLQLKSQDRVKLFDIQNPEASLSDHHGLVTIFK